LVAAVSTTLGESLTDVVDTLRAVAEVVVDQVEEGLKGDQSEEE